MNTMKSPCANRSTTLLAAVTWMLSGCVMPDAVQSAAGRPGASTLTTQQAEQIVAQRFRDMPADDEVIAATEWYQPRARIQGVSPDTSLSSATQASPLQDSRFNRALTVAREYDSLAVVVMVDGRIIAEDYAAGIDPSRQLDSQSMHRGLLSLAVLAAIEDGAIRSLDQSAADFFEEWRVTGDLRRNITVGHLLRGESGLVDPPYEARPDAPGMQLFIGTDLRRLALSQQPSAPAGTKHRGNALDAQVLGLLLEEATREPYASYLGRRIWQRIGAADAWVRLDREGGNTRTFCCLQASARDWARIGELVRGEGVVGSQRVLTKQSIAHLLQPSALNKATGMSWLLEPTALVPRSQSTSRPITPTAFAAQGVVYIGGRGGQRVYVLPQQRAVVVRLGRIRNDFDDGRFLNPFIEALSPPVAQLPPPGIPTKPFGEQPHPPAPDYADPASWAALPDRRDAADVVPENDPFGDRQASAAVDVFYIHPTTYRGGDFWNQPLADTVTNDWTDESVIARQAAVFNACCRVFAPRYRQATAAALAATPAMRGLEAYEFAWGDVRRAFMHYLAHWNQGRPFIIAGHSQGATHVERWLNEFGVQSTYRERMVAAYPIGIAYARGQLESMGGGIKICATPTQTNCLVTWNTFDRTGDPSNYLKQSQARYMQRFSRTDGTDIVCVNPLTFALDQPAAAAELNIGALPARPGVGLTHSLTEPSPLPPTEPGRLGATCRDGVLRVDSPPRQGYAIVPLPAGMLHFNDFDLFYANIRANAVARVEAFLKTRGAAVDMQTDRSKEQR